MLNLLFSNGLGLLGKGGKKKRVAEGMMPPPPAATSFNPPPLPAVSITSSLLRVALTRPALVLTLRHLPATARKHTLSGRACRIQRVALVAVVVVVAAATEAFARGKLGLDSVLSQATHEVLCCNL